MAAHDSTSCNTVNKATKIERYYMVGYAPHKPVINRFEQV